MVVDERDARRRAPADRRRVVRYVAAGLSAGLAGCYLALLVLVARLEMAAGGEDTFGAYLFLSVPYLIGAVLLAIRDQRLLWVLGAGAQVGVLTLFVLFGVGVFGPGVFDYATVAPLHMAVWAVATVTAEVVLLGLLIYLAVPPPPEPHEPAGPATLPGR